MRARWPQLLFLAALAAPVAAGLFRVWVAQSAIAMGYRMSEQESARKRLEHDVQQLEIELAAERSPQHLQRLAERHGMAPPSGRQWLAGSAQAGGPHGRP